MKQMVRNWKQLEKLGINVDKNINELVEGVEDLYDGYTDDSASTKKIYCHPIQINSTSETTPIFRLTCLILNNSPTPMTLADFKAFIDDLKEKTSGNGALMVSGGYKSLSDAIIMVSRIYKTQGTDLYSISGLNTSGNVSSGTNADFYTLIPASSNFVDGVNPIN